jgi:hypothetical protein
MHFNTKDLTGMVFGKLRVNGYSHSVKYTKHSKAVWDCTCECGNKTKVTTCHLTSGHTQSCGCSHVEVAKRLNYKHGMSKTRFYQIWLNMIGRCTDAKDPAYKNYGGRGITVCDEWRSFISFYDDMFEGYTEGATLDRIDNNKGYSPENCKWSTPLEQSNNRRTNRLIEIDGQIHTLAEWCRIKKLNYKMVHRRLTKGWDLSKALNTPKRGNGKQVKHS